MSTDGNTAPETPPHSDSRIEAMIGVVEKIQALADLSSTAKAVMIRLTLRYPGRAVRGECPSPAELSPWLGLSERSIRRAYAELEGTGYIGSPTGPDGKPTLPLHDAAIRDGWPHLQEDQPMDLIEHVAHLEWLRDLAVARGRIGVAIMAEKAAGRALGFQGTLRGRIRPRSEAAIFDREGMPIPPAPPPPPPPTAPETTGPDLAETGVDLAEAGSELASSGPNWHELADLGSALRTPFDGGLYSRYKALLSDSKE